MASVMAQSGNVLPQVSSSGGSISGIVHIVTTDGAGPYTAIVDPTATSSFSNGTNMTITKQVPGKKGNIAAPNERRFFPRMLVKMGLLKRAANVNEDYPFAATIPAGTTCTGTVANQTNLCLVKIVNPSGAGPFGGVVAVQMVEPKAGKEAMSGGVYSGDMSGTRDNAESGGLGRRTLVGAKFRL